jgi:hypothetical protein
VKIVQGFPPNIDEILKTFKITDKTIFAYGDTIYAPLGGSISPDLIAHEETHQRQQEKWGVENWWMKYIADIDFRLTQEVEAYQNQYQYFKTVLNRKGRIIALKKLAEDLSSPLYGSIINKKQAQELING